MSVRRLLKVSQVHIRFWGHILLPVIWSVLSAALTRATVSALPFSGIPLVLTQTAVCAVFYLVLYTVVSAAVHKEPKSQKTQA